MYLGTRRTGGEKFHSRDTWPLLLLLPINGQASRATSLVCDDNDEKDAYARTFRFTRSTLVMLIPLEARSFSAYKRMPFSACRGYTVPRDFMRNVEQISNSLYLNDFLDDSDPWNLIFMQPFESGCSRNDFNPSSYAYFRIHVINDLTYVELFIGTHNTRRGSQGILNGHLAAIGAVELFRKPRKINGFATSRRDSLM